MGDLSARILLFLLDTAGPVALGFWLRQRGLASKAFTDLVIRVNVRVVFTILAFISFWKLSFTADMAVIPAAGLLALLVPCLLGMALTRRNPDPLERGALVLSAMLGNTGTVGGLAAYLIIGPAAFACVQLAALIQSLIVVLLCFPMCQRFRDQADAEGGPLRRRTFREVFLTWNQVSILGMIAGAALSIGGVGQPEELASVFGALVHLSTWVKLIPVGMLLDIDAIRAVLKRTLIIIPVKFIAVPAFIWLFSRACLASPALTASLVIMSACPTAITAVFTCALYGLRTEIAMASFASTMSVFLMIVCPALFLLFT